MTQREVMYMRILIVEDDVHIHQMISEYLQLHGYACTSAYSGSEAELRLKQEAFDVILLDLMLPGICGEALIHTIKTLTSASVIVISAKDDVETKVMLLQNGADDYICKPFDLKELLARIEVRKRQAVYAHTQTQRDGLTLHEDHKTVDVQGKKQTLTKHEYDMLALLMSNPKRAFTKQEIYEMVWHEEVYIEDKTINVHISNLRKKLAQISEHDYIETIWGIGFKWKEQS